jgi:hypothetical protein
MVKMAGEGFLNIRASVIDKHIILIAVVAICCGGGGGVGRRGHRMQNNQKVMREIRIAHFTLIIKKSLPVPVITRPMALCFSISVSKYCQSD